MARVLGAVDEAGLLPTVVREALLQVEDPERLLRGRDQRDLLAVAQGVGRCAPNGQRDRQRPGESARQPHLVQDSAVVGFAHEPLEGAVSAGGEQLQIRHHPGVQRDPLE
jgi:hypothetical protein